MSYYQDWQTRSNDTANPAAADAFIKSYYVLEKEAYAAILAGGESRIAGSALDLAARLGFGRDMAIFLGFLDGIAPSLKTAPDLDLITDDSPLVLDIDFPLLYRNMHAAKADWLYGLKEWNRILPPDEQQRLTREYRESKIVRHEKIGRNDPCPCGSGKKYKSCCGKGGPA